MAGAFPSFCFSSHIPLESDLILIELAINDEPLDEHTENMENLLRSLLNLPRNPAVVMIEALGLGGGSMRYGGDIHTPVAIYYGERPCVNKAIRAVSDSSGP